MNLRVPAMLSPPPVREGADAVAVLATHAGGWAAGGASLVAYGVQRAVGLSPHPSYLLAALLVFVSLALLRTPWQRVAPVSFVFTLFGLTVAVAFEEPSIFHPALPVLILCLAFAGFCLSTPWTVTLAVAELVAVAAIYGAGESGRAVAATGFSPVRNLTVLVVCIVVAAVLFSAIGRAARRARTVANESAERAWREVQRRKEAEARLARSARLEALGRLAGGVAHDFNNLMSAVSSNLESARPALVQLGRTEIVERIEAALQAVARGARLTRQLLSYSKKQTVRVQAVDVAALVDSMLPLVRRAAGEQNTVLVRMAPDLPLARSDPGQLEAAVLNLVLNARDAMPAGGEVVLEVTEAILGPGDVPDDVTPGVYVVVTVADAGVGMDAETLARATEPFFTTKKDGQGTGLGLAMVQGFARRVGGAFELSSAPGEGTIARLLLPKAEGLERSADATEGSGIRRAFGGGRLVLVVEDDPDVREASVALFDALDFRPLPVENGPAALEVLARHRPDLLFTDVVLPGGLSGVELARRVRAMHPRLPVLLTSGYTGDDLGPVDDFPILHKPFRARELRAQLQALLPDRVEDEPGEGTKPGAGASTSA